MTGLRQRAADLDRDDRLAPLRDRFHLPPGLVYLDGNSLGPMPIDAPDRIADTVRRAWGDNLIESWLDDGWWHLPETLGDRLAPLIGAGPGQTIVADGTSICLYKALHAALSLAPERTVIVAERRSFPTDLYMIEGLIAATGRPLELRLADGPDAIPGCLGDDVAVALLSAVDYRTGELLDMARLTDKAHACGAAVIWDLCHAAGVVPVALDDWAVDFAVGCTYKYLNGGPGGQAFLYAASRHHPHVRQPLTGWWGHAEPFAFETAYRPASSMRRFLTGSQAIIGLRAVECGIDSFAGVDIADLRAKSLSLTGLFMEAVEPLCARFGMTLLTPREPARRGSQVAIAFEHGYAVVRAMIEARVIGDFRSPDVMRFGFAPAYLSHADVLHAADTMAQCLAGQVWREVRFTARSEVT